MIFTVALVPGNDIYVVLSATYYKTVIIVVVSGAGAHEEGEKH